MQRVILGKYERIFEDILWHNLDIIWEVCWWQEDNNTFESGNLNLRNDNERTNSFLVFMYCLQTDTHTHIHTHTHTHTGGQAEIGHIKLRSSQQLH